MGHACLTADWPSAARATSACAWGTSWRSPRPGFPTRTCGPPTSALSRRPAPSSMRTARTIWRRSCRRADTRRSRTMTEHATDRLLRDRARAVIPGGMYGHQSAMSLPPAYPQFMRGGRGARIWDVDGNEYVDLMCSYGPVVLGHQPSGGEAAVSAQAALGDCQNAPGPVMVDLAELLVRTVRHADWAMFAKNGTDATTMCCTIARAQTGRRKILGAAGAYHGAAPCCTPRPAGTPPQAPANLAYYTYNDLPSVRQAATEAGDDLAAIVVSPFKHNA